MIGIDANVLVALAVEEHPSHSPAVSAFDHELAAENADDFRVFGVFELVAFRVFENSSGQGTGPTENG